MRAAVVTSLLFALVAISCTAAWIFAWRTRNPIGERPSAPVSEQENLVPSASGDLILAGGRRVSVQVTRLHADAVRQRFDAEALRARFSLSEGEPFQCRLELFAEGDGAPAHKAFDLADLVIRDERGLALAPLYPSVSAPEDGVVDPLATLVAPPDVPLMPENRVAILMWGRVPAGQARLETCCERAVELRAVDVSSRDVDTSLARIRREVAASAEEPK